LLAWQRAMRLAEEVYRLARQLRTIHEWDLYRQINRAAQSVPANIAEGYGTGASGTYRHHLRIARGSLHELETHLELILRLGFAPTQQVEPVQEALVEVSRLLTGLLRSLTRS
jgi:four helix bundle protein